MCDAVRYLLHAFHVRTTLLNVAHMYISRTHMFNSLQYLAVSNLDAATFQVTYQLKILTTALFSVWMLGRTLRQRQWGALVLLTCGVALVQLSSSDQAQAVKKDGSAKSSATTSSALIGLIAVLCACCISGAAGVYFEKILKQSGSKIASRPVKSKTSEKYDGGNTTMASSENFPLVGSTKASTFTAPRNITVLPPSRHLSPASTASSLWARNVQLATFGTLLATLIMLWQDGRAVTEHGMLYGYTSITWWVVWCQAIGGLIVALVVKYADNILKGISVAGVA